ncbi:zinc-finger binding domain of transposase IS66 family protein [Geobacillus kaustophilus]|uniref:Zinc-finger binding domain of transposase IS66 family protein n=2 Tax=Geobacillus kaustophilus TaxID=1462 RepID=A0A0D8BVT7_GEOKU|nr:IS66 family transposase [Geobacillus kaustophilus]KJE26901.1 zinc-finger binding domain of transposase IS66 family protein [Geobacillus kaustophilus]KJE28235.1 zinc-finger binding domain of transposase IS66 family protein [Geobacillus kaustophilus]
MLTVQQAVFTVESLISKVQQQKQLIHQLIQENEHLRQENKQLRKENEQLKYRVQELEARTKKNSSNSHLPPSSDRFEKKRSSREPSGKKPGGREGHEGTTLRQVEHPHHRVVHRVDTCQGCGSSLRDVKPFKVDVRQVFDLPPVTMEVTQHEREVKSCPHCRCVQQAEFPSHVTNHVQYGPRITALVVYLYNIQMIPYQRLRDMMEELYQHPISTGTLVNMVKRGREALEPNMDIIEEALLQSDILHVDETSLRIDGKQAWVHVACTSAYTYLAPHASRGKKATDEIGILPRYKGTMMHDAFGTYPRYTEATHALCHAHHLRDLKGFIEQGHTWAKRMTTFLLNAKQVVEQHGGFLPEEEAKRWEHVYDRILEKANHQLEGMTPLPKKALSFVRRLQKRKEEALRFLREAHVPFDNNQAERDLRMVKVKENISGTFRQETFAQSFCIARSIVSTLTKHEKNVWDSLCLLLTGETIDRVLSAT